MPLEFLFIRSSQLSQRVMTDPPLLGWLMGMPPSSCYNVKHVDCLRYCRGGSCERNSRAGGTEVMQKLRCTFCSEGMVLTPCYLTDRGPSPGCTFSHIFNLTFPFSNSVLLLLIISLVPSATSILCLGFCLLQIAVGLYVKPSGGGGLGKYHSSMWLQPSGTTWNVLINTNISSMQLACFLFSTSLSVCVQDRHWKLLHPRSCCFVAGTQSEKVAALVPAWAGTRERWLQSMGRSFAWAPTMTPASLPKSSTCLFSGAGCVHLVLTTMVHVQMRSSSVVWF